MYVSYCDHTGGIHAQGAKFKVSQGFKGRSQINNILKVYLLLCSQTLHEREKREEALDGVTLPSHRERYITPSPAVE